MNHPLFNDERGILRASLPLFSGSFVAQGINFLTLFLMPWFFPAQEIGPFFVFSAVGQILISLISLRSSNSIVLSRNNKVAASNLGFSLLIGVGLSLLLFLPASLFQVIPLPASLDKWADWFLLIPVFSLLGNVASTLEYYLNYKKKYRIIGLSYVVKNTSILVLTVALGWVYPFSISIILAAIGGQFFILLFLIIWGQIPFKAMQIRMKSFKIFLLRYRETLIYNTLMTGLQQVTSHLPVIILALLFDARLVAFYGVAFRVLATPLSVWGMSVSKVFYKKCVDRFNQSNPFFSVARETLGQMILWALLFAVPAFILAPKGFAIFLGAEWEEAGKIGRMILPLIVVQNISIPFSVLYNILRTQRRIVWYYLIGLVVRVAVGLFLPWYVFGGDYQWVLISYSVIGVLYYLAFVGELLTQVRRYDASLTDPA